MFWRRYNFSFTQATLFYSSWKSSWIACGLWYESWVGSGLDTTIKQSKKCTPIQNYLSGEFLTSNKEIIQCYVGVSLNECDWVFLSGK